MAKPTRTRPARRAPRAPGKKPRLGVWLFGAYGGLATTVVTGCRAIARKLSPPHGLTTATPLCEGLDLTPLDGVVFGGHEVREGDFVRSATEIHEQGGSIPWPLLQALRGDLRALDKNVRRGVLVNPGATIERMVGSPKRGRVALRTQVDRLRADLREFQQRHKLDRVVCVNLTSTEPPLPPAPAHRTIAAFEQALDRGDEKVVRSSTLYAYAAASLGLPFVHFTPSDAALVPAIRQLFEQNGAPYMGADGKTGETLVKSALAPMFKYRNLRVLTWQGYNILGDRDGVVLADAANKQAKVQSKDGLLPRILGYPLHTHVGIDYVPSLHDHKTAWDFIHFEGFLGHRMAMQFTWQGCDAILAAPLVLDLVRFADLAARRGEHGPMHHLACFFKAPLDGTEHDLHAQWHALGDYVQRARG
ncbi:MAG: inositol-3-phosphate synthase [Planctomycetota bacterium]